MAADTVGDTVPPAADGLAPETPTLDPRRVPPEVDVPALAGLLDGRHAEVRDLVRRNLATYASVLDEAETLPREEYRDRVRDLVLEMAATGQTGMGFPEEYGGGGDLGASIAAFETLAYGDLSVLVKVGVQFGLFGGAILQLGTRHHHDAFLRDLVSGRLMGCFAMTETGHGSNVQALGTVAAYDADAGEFVISTNGEQSRKDYIGKPSRMVTASMPSTKRSLPLRPATRRPRLCLRARWRRIVADDLAELVAGEVDRALALGVAGLEDFDLAAGAQRVTDACVDAVRAASDRLR